MSTFENPGQNLLALLPETASTGEIFNLNEDGSVARGQLRRFLKMFGAKLDEMKGLVDAFPTMVDVDITDSDYLPLIAELVGVKFNREIPIPQAREEIKDAVQWYKRKGTLVGCRIHGYKISRLQTDIVEFWKNIKTAVTLPSTPGNIRYTFSAEGAGTRPVMGLPGDPTAYAYDYNAQDVLSIGMQFASSDVSGYEAWRAVDDAEATSWKAAAPAPGYWGFSYPTDFLPLRFRIKAGLGLERFKLQWADDPLGTWNDVTDYVFGDVRTLTYWPADATGLAQTLVLTRVPISPLPAPEVYEVTGYGSVNTEITAAAQEGDTILYLRDAGGLSIDDWIELHSTGDIYEYLQVRRIEGNLVTVRTGVTKLGGWPSLTPVKKATAVVKQYTIDYTIDFWEGLVDLVAGQFTAGNHVFVNYTALYDKNSIHIWREFAVDQEDIVPHKHWRLYVESTWLGNPEIAKVEFFPDQFFGTYYRGERLGYYFTLGNARPGCRGNIICNKPFLQETVEKLCRTMPEAVPVCAVPVMIALDCHYPEPILVEQQFDDRRHDEINTRNRETFPASSLIIDIWRDIITSRLLISTYNPTPLVVNPATLYYERGSPTYITGSPLLNPDGLTWISAWIHP